MLRRMVALLVLPLALGASAAHAFQGQLATISQQALPASGVETLRNIQRGGPFPFEKDGVIFGNRERLLPLQKRGFYREYTVKTPGSRDRGAQRIVCGGPATTPEVCYYTADHYASFRMIAP
jgi:ribonuclease T1